jgi:hypothetical protein
LKIIGKACKLPAEREKKKTRYAGRRMVRTVIESGSRRIGNKSEARSSKETRRESRITNEEQIQQSGSSK